MIGNLYFLIFIPVKPGDLVRYVLSPIGKPPNRSRVIPENIRPIGIVVDIRDQVIGEGDTSSILEIILVRWSDKTWNTTDGLSEEFRTDLEIVQKI